MSTPKNIVIVGAGVIGVSTAYYLSHHPSYDPCQTTIKIIECCEVAAGASGKAGGLLALDWHSAATTSLAALSYRLHADLADEHGGSEEWGYRQLNTLSAQVNCKRRGGNKKQVIKDEIDWLDKDVVEKTGILGTKETTAQVHPRKFCREILKLSEKAGVEYIQGKVGVIQDGSVRYSTADGEVEIKSDCTIVTAGPWTTRILPRVPVIGTRAHSITIIPAKPVSAHAVFTSMTLENGRHVTPELYARSDEIYVCGDGDSEPLPKDASQVEVVEAKCDELFDQASQLSTILRHGKIGVKQACYLPVADTASGSPLVGRVPNMPGVYVATAHSCWGICLAPGTGKVMSEMIFDGRVSSADIKQLDPLTILRK